MNKKILAFVMALVLCFSCVSALATESKTTSDVVAVTITIASSSDTAEEPIVVVITEPTVETQAVLAEIAETVAAGAPVVEYFDEETAAAIKTVAGEKTEALQLDELVPMVSSGVVEGAATITVRTAASYTEDDAVVVLAGVTINGEKVWTVLTYTIVDGELVITFPEEIAALLADGVIDLAILSDKAA